jgi:hypothetical protein
MKKIILVLFVLISLCSCSIFRGKEKYGCPTSGAAIGAERIASGDQKAMKASSKSKYRGGKKIYR